MAGEDKLSLLGLPLGTGDGKPAGRLVAAGTEGLRIQDRDLLAGLDPVADLEKDFFDRAVDARGHGPRLTGHQSTYDGDRLGERDRSDGVDAHRHRLFLRNGRSQGHQQQKTRRRGAQDCRSWVQNHLHRPPQAHPAPSSCGGSHRRFQRDPRESPRSRHPGQNL